MPFSLRKELGRKIQSPLTFLLSVQKKLFYVNPKNSGIEVKLTKECLNIPYLISAYYCLLFTELPNNQLKMQSIFLNSTARYQANLLTFINQKSNSPTEITIQLRRKVQKSPKSLQATAFAGNWDVQTLTKEEQRQTLEKSSTYQGENWQG